MQAPILTYPDPKGDFILDTDASGTGIGAVLSQLQEGTEKVIGYHSRILTKAERNYCVTRQELLAVKEAVTHFHPYVCGVHFKVRTDHGSLNWLMNFKNLDGQLCRWSLVLGTYDYTIHFRQGRAHKNADGLSRCPCGNCRYCEKVEEKQSKEEVSPSLVNSTSFKAATGSRVTLMTKTKVCRWMIRPSRS